MYKSFLSFKILLLIKEDPLIFARAGLKNL